MKYGIIDGKQIFSEIQAKEMWKPQTILPIKNPYPFTTNFSAYRLGWRLSDINGHLEVSHTVGLDGIVTQTVMIPDIYLGIIVLTNQQNGTVFFTYFNTIKNSYLGLPDFDLLNYLSNQIKQRENEADKITDEVRRIVAKN